MKKLEKTARIILTVAGVGTIGSFITQDVLNHSHIFNSMWPPHARFHAIMDVYVSIGVTLLALWLIWQRQRFTTRLGIILLLLIETGFVLGSVVVGKDGSAPPGTPTVLGTKPPVLFAIIFMVLTLLSWYWLRSESSDIKNK